MNRYTSLTWMITSLLSLEFLGGQAFQSAFDKLPSWQLSIGNSAKLGDKFVFRDDDTQELVILLAPDPAALLMKQKLLRYRPQNQVKATISQTISPVPEGYAYRYSVTNGQGARLAIDAWSMVVGKSNLPMIPSHPRWAKVYLKDTSVEQSAIPGVEAGRAVYWGSRIEGASMIDPGTQSDGFSVRSPLLPGFTTANVKGGEPLSTPGELPRQVGDQLIPLMKMKESTQSVVVLGPRFQRDVSRQAIAADYRKGLGALKKEGRIDVNSPFVRLLSTALADCEIKGVCRSQTFAALTTSAASPIEKDIAMGVAISLGRE